MVCEQYRDGVMALLDGEIAELERQQVEDHLHHCPTCQKTYLQFERLACVTKTFSFPPLQECDAHAYWKGVCGKMEVRPVWGVWLTGAGAMVGAGSLMIHGFDGSVLATSLGGAAIAMGAGILWLSFYCHCNR